MSGDNNEARPLEIAKILMSDNEADTCCASCGIAENDDIKLKDCDDCDLVKYCSDQCKDDHQPQHKKDCKKRAAGLLLLKELERLVMSTDNNNDDSAPSCCASCGITENDVIKLMPCDDCDLVKYCSDECQQNHKSEHEEACKKRAAELRDELLFKQPESSHMGDCPICCVPLPLDLQKTRIMACCSKIICNGCDYANTKRELNQRLQHRCLFCREPFIVLSKEEADKLLMKRVETNDPVVLREAGSKCRTKGDYKGAFEYWTKAVELGNVAAHHDLSVMYNNGHFVEKDEKKEVYHLEEAAIGGHLDARYTLGLIEFRNGKKLEKAAFNEHPDARNNRFLPYDIVKNMDSRFERAIKHWVIAANLGHGKSMSSVKKFYPHGWISKEDFAAVLRAHQAAVDATKSPDREAEILWREMIGAANNNK